LTLEQQTVEEYFLVAWHMTRIDGVRAKIKRAKKHIDEFESLADSYIHGDFCTIGAKPKHYPGNLVIYVTRIDPIPEDIPLIFGDAVHNLRSALDHLAWQLVEAGGGTPSKDTYFPISKTPEGYKSAIGKGDIDKMPLGAEKELALVQPYATGDNTLWHLHKLDIADKHRLVITCAHVAASWGLKKPSVSLGTLGLRIPLEAGAEITNIPADTYEKSKDNIRFAYDITFGQSEILSGELVFETLNKMFDWLMIIADRFEPFLA
jgi:hypothetical protein